MARRKGSETNVETPTQGLPAPQAAPHRRGGTHRVKKEHQTGSEFDDMNHVTLKRLTKERGVYQKDAPKHEMARALKELQDRHKREERELQAGIQAANKRERKAEAKKEELKRQKDIEKAKRLKEKEAAKARGDEVSEDEADDEDVQRQREQFFMRDGGDGNVGWLVDDTCTESVSTDSDDSNDRVPAAPSDRLRLFEWKDVSNSHNSITADVPRGYAHQIYYASMKVSTTKTGKRIILPGHDYSPGVDHDFVPRLSEKVQDAARNGLRWGPIRNATIHKATDWTKHTHINGSTGQMFFSLPPQVSAKHRKSLRDIYDKYREANRNLLRVKRSLVEDKRYNPARRPDRVRRHHQRHINRGRMMKEVYEVPSVRPRALVYQPAYLDPRCASDGMSSHRSIENLFYLRFPGQQVPHYYFWAEEQEWSDPTVPNPAWDNFSETGDEYEKLKAKQEAERNKTVHTEFYFLEMNDEIGIPPRIHNLAVQITQDLYTSGVDHILAQHREKWSKRGDAKLWIAFSHELQRAYPGGCIPVVPPEDGTRVHSLAIKLAATHVLRWKSPLFRLDLEDAWDVRDNEVWRDIEIDNAEMSDVHNVGQRRERSDRQRRELCRRRSGVIEYTARWLENVDSSDTPLSPGSMVDTSTETFDQDEDEDDLTQRFQPGMGLACPSCRKDLTGMSLKMQAAHMQSHDIVPRGLRRS